MTSDKPGEFDDCGCPSHVDQNGRRTVNPNCEHLRVWLDPVADGFRCSNCGRAFLAVPSDALEEARRVLAELTRDHFRETLIDARMSGAREAFAQAMETIARIDAVLGQPREM
jgi:hypothetical protein